MLTYIHVVLYSIILMVVVPVIEGGVGIDKLDNLKLMSTVPIRDYLL